MKLTFHEIKCIDDVATCAVESLPHLPPAKRAVRLRGIGLIFSLIGRAGPARFAHNTADLMQQLHMAEQHLQDNLREEGK